MRKVFTVNGTSYMYDYDQLTGARVVIARRIAELHIDRKKSPPRSINELRLMGEHLWEAEFFSYLLTKLDENGMPLPWDKNSSPDDAKVFFENLPASAMDVIDLCRSDFFAKARIVNPDAIERLQAIMRAIKEGSIESTTAESDANEQSEKPNEPDDSTSLPNSNDE